MLDRIKQTVFLISILPIRLVHSILCDDPECLEYYNRIGRGI